jgi:hypothetical protein
MCIKSARKNDELFRLVASLLHSVQAEVRCVNKVRSPLRPELQRISLGGIECLVDNL